jgi:hypothetical protein
MAYVPDWESLAETLARVMARGYSMSDAQRDICRALSDDKLHQRYRVTRVQTPYGAEVSRRLIGQPRSREDLRDIIGQPRVPIDLSPDELDWENSRPKHPWLDKHGFLVGIDKIEFSTKDVIQTLCVGPSGVSSAGPSSNFSPTGELPEACLANEAVAEPPVETVAEPAVEAVAEPAVEAGAKKPLTIGEETRATIALEQGLRANDQMSTEDAKLFLREASLPLDGRPFRRVWANARVRAGLSRTAKRGRKPNLPR